MISELSLDRFVCLLNSNEKRAWEWLTKIKFSCYRFFAVNECTEAKAEARHWSDFKAEAMHWIQKPEVRIEVKVEATTSQLCAEEHLMSVCKDSRHFMDEINHLINRSNKLSSFNIWWYSGPVLASSFDALTWPA